MVEPMAQVMLALPVTIALAGGAACLEETRWLAFCCQLLTTRLTRVLRFQSGKVRPPRERLLRCAGRSRSHGQQCALVPDLCYSSACLVSARAARAP